MEGGERDGSALCACLCVRERESVRVNKRVSEIERERREGEIERGKERERGREEKEGGREMERAPPRMQKRGRWRRSLQQRPTTLKISVWSGRRILKTAKRRQSLEAGDACELKIETPDILRTKNAFQLDAFEWRIVSTERKCCCIGNNWYIFWVFYMIPQC